MSSKAITEKKEGVTDRPLGEPVAAEILESGPSVVREDDLVFPRTMGMLGAGLIVFASMALIMNYFGQARISNGFAVLILAAGLFGLLFHAAFDRDVQLRRLYLAIGGLFFVAGLVLAFLPYPTMGAQFRWAVPCLSVALLFLLAFLRNETESQWRDITQFSLGGAGLAMAVVGVVIGSIRGEFLLSYGMVLGLLGLLYLASFIGTRGNSDDGAYYSAVGLAFAGLAVLLFSFARPFLMAEGSQWFTDYGAVLALIGGLYALTGFGLFLDTPLAVLTRREISSFFYSPLAYLTLFGFVVLWWITFMAFVSNLFDAESERVAVTEPIVRSYFFALFPVFTNVVVVPILTMRLLSEELRSGTMEVMLTAPVDEPVVVLSKFIAVLINYLLMWLPALLYLLAIPLLGGNMPDYRPLLSFSIIVAVTGSALLSGGLFFSSLTKSQVASGVLTGAFVMLMTFVYFPANQPELRGTAYETILKHMSYLDIWLTSLEGKIVIKFLLFPISLTALFLFLTVKVLESRKWR